MKKVCIVSLVLTIIFSHQPTLVSQARTEEQPEFTLNEKDSLLLITKQMDSLLVANEASLHELRQQQEFLNR